MGKIKLIDLLKVCEGSIWLRELGSIVKQSGYHDLIYVEDNNSLCHFKMS